MLQIHVVFIGEKKRVAQQFFRDELDKMVSECFELFTDSHYTLVNVSDKELLICIDLSTNYSMLFAHKVSEISVEINDMVVQSVNYSL